MCFISRILARDRNYVWEGNSKVVKEVGKTLYMNFERSNKIESERKEIDERWGMLEQTKVFYIVRKYADRSFFFFPPADWGQ